MHDSKSRIVRTRTIVINIVVLAIVVLLAMLLIPGATDSERNPDRPSATSTGTAGN